MIGVISGQQCSPFMLILLLYIYKSRRYLCYYCLLFLFLGFALAFLDTLHLPGVGITGFALKDFATHRANLLPVTSVGGDFPNARNDQYFLFKPWSVITQALLKDARFAGAWPPATFTLGVCPTGQLSTTMSTRLDIPVLPPSWWNDL